MKWSSACSCEGCTAKLQVNFMLEFLHEIELYINFMQEFLHEMELSVLL